MQIAVQSQDQEAQQGTLKAVEAMARALGVETVACPRWSSHQKPSTLSETLEEY